MPAVADVESHGNFVDGREIEAGGGEWLDVRNPATGGIIARIPNSTADDIGRAIKSARTAFEGSTWGGMDIRARARLVNRLADAFEANLDVLYRLETRSYRGCRISSATSPALHCRDGIASSRLKAPISTTRCVPRLASSPIARRSTIRS
jgi:acyl-CoA reductase-like NAD-dependent aldehyde dehydrogenase